MLQVVLVALLGALSVAACADDLPSATTLSGNCRDLLQQSERAALEWQLEQDFGTFERGISGLAAAT